jgi:hypothetical protein
MSKQRDAVHELDRELRDRLLALDEPVAQPDWRDVLSRSGADRPRPRMAAQLTLVATVICVAAIAVAPALGLGLGAVDFWSAPHAPQTAKSAFVGRDLVPDPGRRGLNLAQIRRLAVEVFKGETERLFVAPRAGGGFCYEWSLEPGEPGIWADELGGCAAHSHPLFLSYDDTRVSIVATRRLVDRVIVTLSNGRTVEPNLHWVSAPVNAGFFLYQPPGNSHVIQVDAIGRDGVVESDPIDQHMDGGSR